MREYEFGFVVRGSETDEVVEAIVDRYQEIATEGGAEVVNVDKWGDPGQIPLPSHSARIRPGLSLFFPSLCAIVICWGLDPARAYRR